MKQQFWKAIAARIVNNPARVKRIIERQGLGLLGGKLLTPQIGEFLTEDHQRVIVLSGVVVLRDALGRLKWVMAGDTFENNAYDRVAGIEDDRTAVLVF